MGDNTQNQQCMKAGMKNCNRIRTFPPDSPQRRVYGISRRVTNQDFGPISARCSPLNEVFIRSKISREAYAAGDRLLSQPGITELVFRDYEIEVTLASVFDWGDIHGEVMQILKECFFEDTDEVQVQDKFTSDQSEVELE